MSNAKLIVQVDYSLLPHSNAIMREIWCTTQPESKQVITLNNLSQSVTCLNIETSKCHYFNLYIKE